MANLHPQLPVTMSPTMSTNSIINNYHAKPEKVPEFVVKKLEKVKLKYEDTVRKLFRSRRRLDKVKAQIN
eukprot:7191779-Karenia_brevis.AAC.1